MTSAVTHWKEDLHAALALAAEHPEVVALIVSDDVCHAFEEHSSAYPDWTWLSCDSYAVARACGACVRDPLQPVHLALWLDESALAQWQDDLRMLQGLPQTVTLTVYLCGPCAQRCAEDLASCTDYVEHTDLRYVLLDTVEENTQPINKHLRWQATPTHYQWYQQSENTCEARMHVHGSPTEVRQAMSALSAHSEIAIQVDQRFPLEAGGIVAWAQVAAQGRQLVLDMQCSDFLNPRICAQFSVLADAGLPLKCVLHGQQDFASASFFADLCGIWLQYPADAAEAWNYWQQDLCHNWPSILVFPDAWCDGLQAAQGDFCVRSCDDAVVKKNVVESAIAEKAYVLCMPAMYAQCLGAQQALKRIDIVVHIQVISSILPPTPLAFSDAAKVLMVDAFAQPYLLRRFQRQMVEKNWQTTRVLDAFACGGNPPQVADIAAAVRSMIS